MTVPAWCGHCGESFDLAEVLAPAAGGGEAGHCPRCGAALAPGYLTVLMSAARSLTSALESAGAAAAQLRDIAPALHVDHRAVCDRLREALDH